MSAIGKTNNDIIYSDERLPFLSLFKRDRKEYLLKRFIDIALSTFGILFFYPLMVIIAFCILIEDGRPIFYLQDRLGKDGKNFLLVKFRSMVKGAEEKTGAVLAKEKDERVTKVGQFLRKTALDELPQLFNIIKGEISFVGPRPERPELNKVIKKQVPYFEKRLKVKPGLTGLAQVYGRYDTKPSNKIRYDLLYIDKMNFGLDLKLIYLSTILTVKGAWNKRSQKR